MIVANFWAVLTFPATVYGGGGDTPARHQETESSSPRVDPGIVTRISITRSLAIPRLIVECDNATVIADVNGVEEVAGEGLPLLSTICSLISPRWDCTVSHIYTETNGNVDFFSKLARA
ncbi:hypothetical protein JCGZ_18495 [Jatropha curcas]|uniref:RNase H type-1 domain-containing protein n=1 Tax=Jatropha curcas TaxID=180498 RepID=A0A067K118_JATCU|nr:hypothetical protein JCGZ_18495 [Jatropha curcas]